MLHLTTGGNGAGKTLFTLKEVRERQLKENRPVFHNGRFKLTADFGWKEIDFKDWQDCPDGSIFMIDECHNDMPVRRSGSDVPDAIKMLAEHRRRGMDFYLITQHPGNIDLFVRRLISSPGWHRHLKRTFGAQLVSQLEWSAVNIDCEKPGSGASGTVTTRPFPTEVYTWYESAMLHTGKKKVPFQVWLLGAIAVALPVLGYMAWTTVGKTSINKAGTAASASPAASAATGTAQAPANRVQTPAEYVASFVARVPGLPHTAPRYDDVTKPTTAPIPSACIATKTRCECYTQQGTKLQTPADLCRQFVANGYFQDWDQRQAPTDRKPQQPHQVQASNTVHPIVGETSLAPDPRLSTVIGALRSGKTIY